MKVFNLPDLGEGLPDAEIKEWYVKEGDEVAIDQPIVAMETAKAVVDVPSPQAGKIAKMYGDPGDIIETGKPLIAFAVAGIETQTATAKAVTAEADMGATVAGKIEVGDTVIQEAATGIAPTQTATKAVKIIPALRALATKLKVDVNSIQGSGPGGSITKVDIESAAQKTAVKTPLPISSATTVNFETVALRGVRRSMANAMAKSHAEVVPVTIVDDADINHWPEKTDITYRIIQAIIAACETEPSLNAHFDANKLERKIFSNINLGLALDSADGLFVPVMHDIQNQSAEKIRENIDRFKTQIQDRSIPQEELTGSTIQLSNFGMFAGRYANPVVVPPGVAIVGIGGIRGEVVAVDHAFALHKIMPISLTFDHRAVTGGEAARFLRALLDALQQ
ncbi:MAG: dihydrolipoamide acetyltransferase family protein [Pseudomonadota bacterium]